MPSSQIEIDFYMAIKAVMDAIKRVDKKLAIHRTILPGHNKFYNIFFRQIRFLFQ